ncbi:uncharacterized protein METZ01_LOCUS463922, partial [marine metagenome]
DPIRILNSTISNNTATGGSSIGGLFVSNVDSITLAYTEISGNSGSSTGGMNTYQSQIIYMSNCLVVDNTGGIFGGVSFLDTRNRISQILNCTIANNSYTYTGSGQRASQLIVERESSVSVINSIISTDQSPGITLGNNSTDGPAVLTVNYSLIRDGQDSINIYTGSLNWGSGNIDVDPRFVDTDNDDYHLADWSPCIGTGLDTSIVSSTDIEGSLRPNPAGSNPDMGAYENALDAPIEHIVITLDTLLV